MAQVIFYEKPRCIGNAKQKKLLQHSGHVLDVRDLTQVRWQPETLRPFFRDRPVTEWFNLSAPAVKSGAVRPEAMSEAEALDALISDPLLIRRPLLQVGDRQEAGFDTPLLKSWIGLDDEQPSVGEGCPRTEEWEETSGPIAAEPHQDFVRRWGRTARLEPIEIDCAVAVMLKILDGKCKMRPEEKVTMEALYDGVKERAGQHLGDDVHALIAKGRQAVGDDLIMEIYTRRVLAETVLSRPVMKGFKARLRTEGVLTPSP